LPKSGLVYPTHLKVCSLYLLGQYRFTISYGQYNIPANLVIYPSTTGVFPTEPATQIATLIHKICRPYLHAVTHIHAYILTLRPTYMPNSHTCRPSTCMPTSVIMQNVCRPYLSACRPRQITSCLPQTANTTSLGSLGPIPYNKM